MKKRVLALALALCMAFSLSVTASAVEEETTAQTGSTVEELAQPETQTEEAPVEETPLQGAQKQNKLQEEVRRI